MINFSVIVLLSTMLLAVSSAAVPKNNVKARQTEQPSQLYWFSTKSVITEYTKIDFRGCYGPECVYVASAPHPNFPSKKLGIYNVHDKLWARKFPSEESVEYVFSHERPMEVRESSWATPVSEQRIIPAVFNASRFRPLDEPDPHVAEFISRLNIGNIRATVEHLAHYHSRNSLASYTLEAANWLKDKMDKSSVCTGSQLFSYRANYAPVVVCSIPGSNPEADPVVIGAHYDSRSTSVNDPSQRAPGADDNGSGSAAVLEILETAASLIQDEGYSFESTLIFAFFSGEEQGLLGSAALATNYKNSGTALTAMINLDMIGYPDSQYPDTLFWMSGSTTRSLMELAMDLTKLYLGQDTLLRTTGACCSDQQSFYSRGYPAASIFESRSAAENPNYHRSSDLPNTITYDHLLRNAQAATALITTIAKISGPLKK